ncbi:MAG TPA: substrate-binding domain-containing protein [Atribacteraceae bacterium]|nr:substrate-binding domain-containing protein [Atribacteraceae bacterium]
MKKVVLLLVVCAMVLLPFSGTLASAQEADLTIGLSFPSLAFAWFAFLEQAVFDKAEILGVEVVSLEAENRVDRQMAIVEDMIIKEVDGVLLVPIEIEAIVPAVLALNAAGIPVVTVDRRLAEGAAEVLAHVGADNLEGGRKAGQFIVDKLTEKYGEPRGVVIELYGTPGAGPAIDRSAGFNEVLAQHPGITVHTRTAYFGRADGMRVMEDVIIGIPEFDAVFGANDEMILGGLEAMKASGVVDVEATITIGFDALPDALASIDQGILDATIEQFPGRQASDGFQVLIDNLREGTVPTEPITLIEPTVITAANLGDAEKAF